MGLFRYKSDVFQTFKNWKVSKGSFVVSNGVKVGTLYLCMDYIVPCTLNVSEKNECLGMILATEKGEKITIVSFDIALWHNRLGHMS